MLVLVAVCAEALACSMKAVHFEEPSTTGGTSGHPLDEPYPQPPRPPAEEKRKEKKKKKERREGRVGRSPVGGVFRLPQL